MANSRIELVVNRLREMQKASPGKVTYDD